MPRVVIQTVEGRSVEKKRELVKRITQCLVDVWDAEPDHVTVFIVEVPAQNFARGGRLLADRRSDAAS